MTVIPLFQKPTQLGYRDTITGVQDNPTQDGFTWNIEDWAFTPIAPGLAAVAPGPLG